MTDEGAGEGAMWKGPGAPLPPTLTPPAPEDVVTPDMLAQVYGVTARVERCSRGRLMVLVDGERA